MLEEIHFQKALQDIESVSIIITSIILPPLRRTNHSVHPLLERISCGDLEKLSQQKGTFSTGS